MNKLFSLAYFVSFTGASLLMSGIVKADTLYNTYPGGGAYGGNAYTDSSGNMYNDAPGNNPGLYGGGVIYDSNMTPYDCAPGAYSTCIKRY